MHQAACEVRAALANGGELMKQSPLMEATMHQYTSKPPASRESCLQGLTAVISCVTVFFAVHSNIPIRGRLFMGVRPAVSLNRFTVRRSDPTGYTTALKTVNKIRRTLE